MAQYTIRVAGGKELRSVSIPGDRHRFAVTLHRFIPGYCMALLWLNVAIRSLYGRYKDAIKEGVDH